MKAKVASLLVVLVLTTTQCMAQKRITVEAQSNDISYNLDLKAVASIFGDSRDLEEFEMKLNDYDSQISNLDLNNDGEVDYLRVIESSENNVHVVVVQAVLDRDVFQDVATIVVEKNRYNRTYVQVIGDPYMYGDNYIIEPVYYHTPSIFSFFWSRRYNTWHSPYYWGYYPSYYRYRNPYEVNIYLTQIHSHINIQHDYRYSDYRRNEYSERLQRSISRNDYSRRYPERTFSSRNENIRNKKDIEVRRSDVGRPSGSRSESGGRNNQGVERTNGSRMERNGGTRNTSPTWNGGGASQRSTTPTGTRNSEIRREPNQNRVNQSTEPRRRSNDNLQNSNGNGNRNGNGNVNGNRNERNNNTYSAPSNSSGNRNERNNNTYSTPSNSRNSEMNNNRTSEPRPSNNRTFERPATNRNEQPTPTIQRENTPNRVAPSNNPSRVEPRQVERRVESNPVERKAPESKPAENRSSGENKSERGSRSSDNNRR